MTTGRNLQRTTNVKDNSEMVAKIYFTWFLNQLSQAHHKHLCSLSSSISVPKIQATARHCAIQFESDYVKDINGSVKGLVYILKSNSFKFDENEAFGNKEQFLDISSYVMHVDKSKVKLSFTSKEIKLNVPL